MSLTKAALDREFRRVIALAERQLLQLNYPVNSRGYQDIAYSVAHAYVYAGSLASALPYVHGVDSFRLRDSLWRSMAVQYAKQGNMSRCEDLLALVEEQDSWVYHFVALGYLMRGDVDRARIAANQIRDNNYGHRREWAAVWAKIAETTDDPVDRIIAEEARVEYQTWRDTKPHYIELRDRIEKDKDVDGAAAAVLRRGEGFDDICVGYAKLGELEKAHAFAQHAPESSRGMCYYGIAFAMADLGRAEAARAYAEHCGPRTTAELFARIYAHSQDIRDIECARRNATSVANVFDRAIALTAIACATDADEDYAACDRASRECIGVHWTPHFDLGRFMLLKRGLEATMVFVKQIPSGFHRREALRGCIYRATEGGQFNLARKLIRESGHHRYYRADGYASMARNIAERLYRMN